ncbi:uncharacterized protein [Lolium perenne]|uniref:uncharacterized protein n=1 Tax=Lolium perenne TaxID=4522 RepID=UPI0021F5413D|nr:uncharacterized protein LOC127298265 [Lolium perenne]
MAYSPVLYPAGLALAAAHVGAATRRPAPSASSPARVHLLPARSATVGPLRAHTRLRFKQRAPADDGAKERQPCAPVNKDGGADQADPYAGLWPWGDYFPGDAELRQEDFSAVQERFWRESKDAAAALRDMVAGAFRPLLDNFHHLRSLGTVYDTEDYHLGMPFGALIACIGFYKLWKMDPSTFLDAALGCAFYKLSIVSSQLRKQGFSNDLVTRVKFVLMLTMAVNDFKNNLCPLDAIRGPIYLLYALTFAYEVIGVKKQIKYAMATLVCFLKHPEGRRHLRELLPEVELEIVTRSGIVL